MVRQTAARVGGRNESGQHSDEWKEPNDDLIETSAPADSCLASEAGVVENWHSIEKNIRGKMDEVSSKSHGNIKEQQESRQQNTTLGIGARPERRAPDSTRDSYSVNKAERVDEVKSKWDEGGNAQSSSKRNRKGRTGPHLERGRFRPPQSK